MKTTIFSEKVLEKGRRLLDQNRVRQAVVYRVQGEHDTYTVETDADPVAKTATVASCTCPVSEYEKVSPCSHVAAVLLMVLEGRPVPVDEVADYVTLEVVE